MKILYVCHETNMGGATRSLLALMEHMIQRGHEVVVLLPNYHGEFINEFSKKKISYIQGRYYPWCYSEKYCKSLKCKCKKYVTGISAFQLCKILKKYDFDIIHTNSSTIDIGLQIAQKLHKPHVFQFREFGLEDQGVVFRDGINKSMQAISNYADIAVFISKCLQDKYDSFLSCKTMVIYNGISSEYCRIKERKLMVTDKVKFLIAGSVVEQKGHKEIIEAAKLLIQRNITNFSIDIIGNGDSLFINQIIEMIDKYGLNEYVHYLGYSNKVQDYRSNTDVELVCSAMEAFGRVTIEAMMAHNPVIASDTGANPELIENGVTGLLYKKGDYVDLSYKMESYIKNHDWIIKMGENAYKHAIENYTSKINADHFETLYSELISKGIRK